MQKLDESPDPYNKHKIQTNYIDVMLQVLPTHEPSFEAAPHMLQRAEAIKGFLRKQLELDPVEGDQKYGVVCHSMIMAALTAEGLDDSDRTGFKDYIWPENC